MVSPKGDHVLALAGGMVSPKGDHVLALARRLPFTRRPGRAPAIML